MSAEVRTIHPNSLANLNRFVPGVSGNPGGVPKGRVFIADCYTRLISLPIDELRAYQPKNGAEAIALKQALNAVDNQNALVALPSAKEIADRTEGRPAQRVELSAIPASDNERIAAAVARVIQLTGCERETAENAVLSQPEFAQLADVE